MLSGRIKPSPERGQPHGALAPRLWLQPSPALTAFPAGAPGKKPRKAFCWPLAAAGLVGAPAGCTAVFSLVDKSSVSALPLRKATQREDLALM